MTSSLITQAAVMNNLFARLSNLSNPDLMRRKYIEMELQHDMKRIIDEMNRREREL